MAKELRPYNIAAVFDLDGPLDTERARAYLLLSRKGLAAKAQEITTIPGRVVAALYARTSVGNSRHALIGAELGAKLDVNRRDGIASSLPTVMNGRPARTECKLTA